MPDRPRNQDDLFDWKHAWLHADPYNAFAIWRRHRWKPLTPNERLAFVLHVAGWPDPDLDLVDGDPTARTSGGDLAHDLGLSIMAYSHDPAIPRDAVMPHAAIGDTPF